MSRLQLRVSLRLLFSISDYIDYTYIIEKIRILLTDDNISDVDIIGFQSTHKLIEF